MDKPKKYILFLMSVFLMQVFLSGCALRPGDQSDVGEIKESKENKSLVSEKSTAEQAVLTIGHRCNGCGLCARLDPEHFVIKGSRKKADVISQSNLESENLLKAVEYCKVRAIIIS